MEFVIWGAGIRGQAFCRFLGSEKVLAFIDTDQAKQGTEVYQRPVISYVEFKKRFSGIFIVISMMYYQETAAYLEKDGYDRYFILSEAPGECYGWGNKNILKELPYQIDYSLPSVIWGIHVFSILLSEKLRDNGCHEIHLVPQNGLTENRKAALRKLLHGWYQDKVDIHRKQNVFLTVEPEEEPEASDSHFYNAYDFSYQMDCYFNPEIAKFKNLYQEKRCFIVATGPSLQISDLDLLYENHEYTISMNKIFYSFSKTLWRPDFYVVEDKLLLDQNREEINSLGLKNMFVADNSQIIMKEGVQRFHTANKDFCSSVQKFSDDVSRVAYQGGTVTYTCIQFAAYMGFREIYLIGTDFSYGEMGSKGNHFYQEEDEKNNPFNYEVCLHAYQTAKKYADEHGIKIFNATRGGALEVFERMDLEVLFRKNKEDVTG